MPSYEIEQLDAAIDALFAGQTLEALHNHPHLLPMIEIASELHLTPRSEFRAGLRDELLAQASMPPAGRVLDGNLAPSIHPQLKSRSVRDSVLPPLFTTAGSMLPVRGSHLAVSFALHVAALAIVFTSGWWMVENRTVVRKQIASRFSGTIDYLLPSSPGELHGGGGGGTQDKMPPSCGSAPRFSDQQLTPPAVIVKNEVPKLSAEPTVIGPPEVKLPQLGTTGDPTAAILTPPSNGTGSGSGIGTGEGTGVGAGNGSGVGEGRGGGIGGGVYQLGGGVSAPRTIYDPDPEYSEEARKAKYQGTVTLSLVVDSEGHPRNVHVVRSLGMGLDEKAIEAVSKWRFEPGLKNGYPVAVQIAVEVVFRLY
jgi:periplasmic protein TonB